LVKVSISTGGTFDDEGDIVAATVSAVQIHGAEGARTSAGFSVVASRANRPTHVQQKIPKGGCGRASFAIFSIGA
jgi:hypothetical protein